MPKVINIEPTPNPDALKFVVQRPILKRGVRSFRDFASAVGDPLGSALFAMGNVTSVFYMDRFVTVNKEHEAQWTDLIDPVCETIEDCQEAEEAEGAQPGHLEGDGTDGKLERINDLLDTRIRPGLAGDGGGLEVISFDGTTLRSAITAPAAPVPVPSAGPCSS